MRLGCVELVEGLRARGTVLGPDDPIAWALLDLASALERGVWCGVVPTSTSS